MNSSRTDVVLSGIGVGLNDATAPAFVVSAAQNLPPYRMSDLTPQEESARLAAAVLRVQLSLQGVAAESTGEAREVLEALAEIVADDVLVVSAHEFINQGWSAASAFGKAVSNFIAPLVNEDAAERFDDFEWISQLVQADLAGISTVRELPTEGRWVLVIDDLTPADTAQFTEAIAGVVTIKGGPTSHASIICAALGIPAVVACAEADGVSTGETLLVDPLAGRVVVNPVGHEASATMPFSARLPEPLIAVRANVGSVQDAEAARLSGASGVGLLRTEFLFMDAQTEPTHEAQVAHYRAIFESSPAGPILVRTLDVAIDKPLMFAQSSLEEQDRGYRFLVDNRGVIERQLDAISAAQRMSGREVWVMAPMLASSEHVRYFAELVRARCDLRVGAMIELVSLAQTVDELAGIVDFVSIGTNDLSQDLFGVDRNSPTDPDLLDHWQPRLMQLIGRVANASRNASIDCSVCGSAASDPTFAVVLAGLGVGSVSCAPAAVASVRASLMAFEPVVAAEAVSLAAGAESNVAAKLIVQTFLSQKGAS
jgi:phosphoenolpyruvate-protein phosphotransferase (PTS system enzyme I)